uniref:Uncharacterized protein n=1 Tax=Gasterosteus aculeatus aculeatus TaxID=481459 RepID=A0AAQ4P6Y5_GASAC
MADGQSSPPCAPLGVLLLLIGGICSVQAGPTDFWCNRQVRKTMEKEIVALCTQVACVGADTLDSPVQLPCVMLHASEWENKTLQQKSAEVVEALRVFWDGVRVAKNQSTSECQTSLLEKLERHMANYVAIVSRLQMQVHTTQTCTDAYSQLPVPARRWRELNDNWGIWIFRTFWLRGR